jgi:catechol 2,3-dioxygenase-like lactoylglutathione lyase family enzyme
VRVGLV